MMRLANNMERARGLSLLRSTSILLAFISFVDPAVGEGESLTVYGEGSGSRTRSGAFSAQLPDGSQCSATFNGGKLSLFGNSEVKTIATCKNGSDSQSVPTVVYRTSTGLPRQAILRFKNGSKVVVILPRTSVRRTPPGNKPASHLPVLDDRDIGEQ